MALEIKNQELFNRVVSNAICKAVATCDNEKTAKRWERAIDRAVAEIESNPFLDFNAEKGELLILSPSNQIYSANGVCQCLAYANGTPCWHRAAARIWRIYTEAKTKPLPPVVTATVGNYNENFLPMRNFKQLEKIGSVHI